jgi:hypothetical protein
MYSRIAFLAISVFVFPSNRQIVSNLIKSLGTSLVAMVGVLRGGIAHPHVYGDKTISSIAIH